MCDYWRTVSSRPGDVFNLNFTINDLKRILVSKRTVCSDFYDTPLKTDQKERTTKWSVTAKSHDKDHYFVELQGEIHGTNVKTTTELHIVDTKDGTRQNIKKKKENVSYEHKAVPNPNFNVNKHDEFEDDFYYYKKCTEKSEVFSILPYIESNDSLTISCRLNVSYTDIVMTSGSLPPQVEKDDKHIGKMKEMLLNAVDYRSDVVLECLDKGEIPCHSSILARGSSYFQGLFESGMLESQSGRVKIQLDKETAMVLLTFMYTGRVDSSKINVNLFQEADKMNMLDLKEKCCQYLIRNINMENCVDAIKLADRLSQHNLKEAGQQFIIDHRKNLTSELKEQLRTNPDVWMEIFENFN